jgi:hypothetical protein
MTPQHFYTIFAPEQLERIFPPERSSGFFEALYGDDKDAAFDIKFSFSGGHADQLHFQFLLEQRPGKCLACNLTYGLPGVFVRHPVINLRGIIDDIAQRLDLPASRLLWDLGKTESRRSDQHAIPLTIRVQSEA